MTWFDPNVEGGDEMRTMRLRWIKCEGNVWCRLNNVNLGHRHFDALEGVYLIWHGGAQPKVVYIGQGVIRNRLKEHRNDKRIQRYAELDLFVTWAGSESQDHYGIKKHLTTAWTPLVVGDEDLTAVEPIEVNSPFSDQ